MPVVVSTVSNVYTEARGLLNDIGAAIFTDAALLPLIKKVYQELQDELALNGLQEVFEADLYFGMAHDATDAMVLISLPSDFIAPIEIWQRPGIDGILVNHPDFRLIQEKKFSPAEMQSAGQGHKYWYWEDNTIKFSGSAIDLTIKVRYIKFLSTIVDINSPIPVLNCQTFMAARLAAVAAVSIGGNLERGEIYQGDAANRLKTLIAIAVKRNQSQPTRRQPFRS